MDVDCYAENNAILSLTKIDDRQCRVKVVGEGTSYIAAQPKGSSPSDSTHRVAYYVTTSDGKLKGNWDSSVSQHLNIAKDNTWHKIIYNAPTSVNVPKITGYKIKINQTSTDGGKLKIRKTKNLASDEEVLIGENDYWEAENQNSGIISFEVQGETAGQVKLTFDVTRIDLKDGETTTTYTGMKNGNSDDTSLTFNISASGEGSGSTITLQANSTTVTIPNKIQITVGNSSELNNKQIRWSVDRSEVANFTNTTNTGCTLNTYEAGTVVVTATVAGDDNTNSASISITVLDAGTSSNVTPTITTPGPIEMTVGTTKQLNADISVTWTSSDPSKVAVGADGMLDAKAITTSPITITATSTANTNKKATIKVSVIADNNGGGNNGGNGNTNGNGNNNGSGNNNENGNSNGNSNGNGNNNGNGSNNGSANVDTKDPVITSSSSSNTLKVGDTIKLSADKTVTWVSGDKKIATIDSNGNVTAVGPGVVQIVAKTSNGRFSTKTLTVVASDEKTGTSTSTSSTDSASSVSSASNKSIPATGEATGGVIAAVGIVVLIIGAAIFRKKLK